ncbi:MAG: DUF4116 domain-containing protein [Rickettsiales bacterium]
MTANIPHHLQRSEQRSPEELVRDRAQALAVLAQNHTLYRGFDRELKADPDIALAYVSAYGWGFEDLPPSLRTNSPSQMELKCALAIAAIHQNQQAVRQLPLFLLEQPTVRDVALQRWDAEALDHCIAEKKQAQAFGR